MGHSQDSEALFCYAPTTSLKNQNNKGKEKVLDDLSNENKFIHNSLYKYKLKFWQAPQFI